MRALKSTLFAIALLAPSTADATVIMGRVFDEWNSGSSPRAWKQIVRVVPGRVHTEEVIATRDTLFFTIMGMESILARPGSYLWPLPATDYDGVRFEPMEGYRYWVRTRPGEPVRLRLDMGRIWPAGDNTRLPSESTIARQHRRDMDHGHCARE